MDAARHEIIARPFRGRARQDRCFDLDEPVFIEGRARGGGQLVPQPNRPLKARAPQVHVPVLKAQLLVGLRLLVDGERQGRRGIVDDEVEDAHFHLARRVLRIGRFADDDDPADAHDVLGVELLRDRVELCVFGMEDDLNAAGRVAQLGEDQLAEVAAAVHPPREDDLATRLCVRGRDLAAADRTMEQP